MAYGRVPKSNTHGWSVSDFEIQRPYLTTFVNSQVVPRLHCRKLVIRAPVKSGKREMIEYLAMRDLAHDSNRVHIFVSSWHRIADEDQRKELALHNLHVFSLNRAEIVKRCIEKITQEIGKKYIILHIDECDHGSGEDQHLSTVYRTFKDCPQLTLLMYSATPQEVLFSSDFMTDAFDQVQIIEYIPPPNFCGPKMFLENGLVFSAEPFFHVGKPFTLSDQGKSIVRDMLAQMPGGKRNFLVLRLSYGSSEGRGVEGKAIYQFLNHIDDFPELADFRIWSEIRYQNI